MKRIILLVLIALIIFDFPCFNDYAQGDFKIKKGENIFQVASNLKKQWNIKSKSVFLMQSLKGNKFKRLKALSKLAKKYNVKLHIPKYKTDNAVMIGVSALVSPNFKNYDTIIINNDRN
jgi:cell division protein YceG involved in septum cleavage